ALHPAFGGNERGVTAFAGTQTVYVVGYLPMKEARAIRAGEANPTAKAEIEEAHGFEKRRVFGERIAVVFNDFRLIDGGETSAHRFMKFLENQGRHRLENSL